MYYVNFQELEGHTSYINDVQFDPDRGEFIASVSDDHTCRIWDNEGTLKASFPLRSPGMSVRWHIEEPAKVFGSKVTSFYAYM